VELNTEAETLRKVPLFAKLDSSRLKLLAFTSHLITFDDQEILFESGDPSDSAYVIMEGDMEILTNTEQGYSIAGVLGAHDLVGEMGVITNSPRSATVRARGPVKALRIDDEMFLNLVAENPGVALSVMYQLSEKIIRTHRQYETTEARLKSLLAEQSEH
jgi:CRP-like cAMP-binding protein